MRAPMMSGHCQFPETTNPQRSHQRCHDQGAGNTATPSKEFAPCPDGCHLDHEVEYECGNCGKPLREAPMWPNEDEPGEMVYVHYDPETHRALGEEC